MKAKKIFRASREIELISASYTLPSPACNSCALASSVSWLRHCIVALERESRSWKKIMNNGLTSGQLSFLLKAGSDTLPTPMNLRRMRIQHDSRCPLCKAPRPTTAHILKMAVISPSIKGDTPGDMTQFRHPYFTLCHVCFPQLTSYLLT